MHSCCIKRFDHHNHPLMHLFFTSSGHVRGQDQDFPSLCPQHPAQDLENSKHPGSVYCVNEKDHVTLAPNIISGSSVTHNKVKGPSGPIDDPTIQTYFPGHNHVLSGSASFATCSSWLVDFLFLFTHCSAASLIYPIQARNLSALPSWLMPPYWFLCSTVNRLE